MNSWNIQIEKKWPKGCFFLLQQSLHHFMVHLSYAMIVFILSHYVTEEKILSIFCVFKNFEYTIYKVYFYNVSMKMLKRIHKILKVIKKFRRNNKSNLNIFLIFAAIVMIWRGIANLLDLYFFPNNPLVGNLICIVLWLFILLLDDWKLRELEWELEKKEEIKKLK